VWNFTHDVSTNNSRVTVGATGRYSIKATIGAEQTDAGRCTLGVQVRVNGTTNYIKARALGYSRGSAYGNYGINLYTELDLTAADYIEIMTIMEDADSNGRGPINTWNDRCELIIRCM